MSFKVCLAFPVRCAIQVSLPFDASPDDGKFLLGFYRLKSLWMFLKPLQRFTIGRSLIIISQTEDIQLGIVLSFLNNQYIILPLFELYTIPRPLPLPLHPLFSTMCGDGRCKFLTAIIADLPEERVGTGCWHDASRP